MGEKKEHEPLTSSVSIRDQINLILLNCSTARSGWGTQPICWTNTTGQHGHATTDAAKPCELCRPVWVLTRKSLELRMGMNRSLSLQWLVAVTVNGWGGTVTLNGRWDCDLRDSCSRCSSAITIGVVCYVSIDTSRPYPALLCMNSRP